MVYVLDMDGRPLMPTERYGKVRRMLRDGRAKVVRRTPFTVQLRYEPEAHIVQDVNLGVDAGSKHIGLSATTDKAVLFECQVELRNDITSKLSTRRELRSARRNRKTRHRKPRFDNRKRDKGWLAPSVQHKVDVHVDVVSKVCGILPISRINVEVASFDIQKMKNPCVEGKGYQRGDRLGFWNVREYVLFRDGHECRCCKGRSGDKALNVHHIESRKTGGDAPDNLVTLCKTCHSGHHRGTVKLPKEIKRGMSFRDAAFMGIVRWKVYERLKAAHGDKVSLTYGYITKNTRIENGLPKEHTVDARCISGNPNAAAKEVYRAVKVRRHNRQLHKQTVGKGGMRRANQAPFEVRGFRLFDKVLCNGKIGFVQGRRARGYFKVVDIDGEVLGTDIPCKRLKRIGRSGGYKAERSGVLSSPWLKQGVPSTQNV